MKNFVKFLLWFAFGALLLFVAVDQAYATSEDQSDNYVYDSESSEYSGSYNGANSYDGSTGGAPWASGNVDGTGTFNEWLMFEGTDCRIIDKFRIFSEVHRIKDWILYGSDNLTDWNEIASGTLSDQSSQQWVDQTFTNTTGYDHLRINFTTTYDDQNTTTQMAVFELEFWGSTCVTPTPTPTTAPTPTPTPAFQHEYIDQITPVPLPTPPDTRTPYLHQTCTSFESVQRGYDPNTCGGGNVDCDDLNDWDYPLAIGQYDKTNHGAWGVSHSVYTNNFYADYKADFGGILTEGDIVDKQELVFLAKTDIGTSYSFAVDLFNAVGTTKPDTVVYFNEEVADNDLEWTGEVKENDLDYTVLSTDVTLLDTYDITLDVHMEFPTSTNFKYSFFTLPNFCVTYWNNNPLGALKSYPTDLVARSGLSVDKSTSISEINPTTCGQNDYICFLKNWFISVIQWLFIPEGFNENYAKAMTNTMITESEKHAPFAYIYAVIDQDWAGVFEDTPSASELQFEVPIESAKINNVTQKFSIDMNPSALGISSYIPAIKNILSVVIVIPFLFDIFALITGTFSVFRETQAKRNEDDTVEYNEWQNKKHKGDA